VVGLLALMFWEHADYKTDLGYCLARPYWRRGIATEGTQRLVQFAFETLCLHRINVDTRMDNIASVRLMAKLGFRYEGARRECVRSTDGTYQTWGLFGMLEDEYFTSPRGTQDELAADSWQSRDG
jgi:ribosomal-protein-alanine N-acetyltransferase